MKICLVRNDKMGDMILTLPVVQGLKEANQDYQIDIICSKKNQKICKNYKSINKIFLLENKFYQVLKIISELRNENYDYIFTFSPGIMSILISIFSKSKTKSLLIFKSRYKNNYTSKFFDRIFGKFFFTNCLIVDRQLRYSQNIPIHQTEIMMELVTKNGLNLNKNAEIKNEFRLNKKDLNSKKLCLIHLSSKWINKYFSEENFINLLDNLKNLKINIVITTDGTSKNVFYEIFKKYEIITNEEFKNLKSINNVLIFDQLNFDNWTSIINSSTYVITPECGCTHIASLLEAKLCVIYDSDNVPGMIAEEYAPWKKKYTKLFSNNQNLEKELISFIS
ncbi:hypothetical protein OA170_02195 [Pelagibacteraceae bacterium]|nr:hypothetical protein [Pelagibacteraceae bacterium]